MKITFVKYLFAVAMVVVAGCSDKNNISQQTAVISTVSTGTWKITYFYDSNVDKTTTFSTYVFTFDQGNFLSATDGTANPKGVWTVTDTSSKDDVLSDLRFNITFTDPLVFEQLTDDWTIVEYTDTKIKLEDVSGGSGGTNSLTFERN